MRLDDIFGQEEAIGSLRRAIQADRLPHGLIFSGPVGVGKGTAARALAGVFLCERPSGATPCGTCPSCTLLPSGNHPDLHIVTRELIRFHDKTGTSKAIDLSIKVIVPELVEPAGRKAVMGRGKVFIVEQAETMNSHAQNSMLKTLEEPAGRTLIILVTDQLGALLPTIRSRTQVIRFAALRDAVVVRELIARAIAPAVAERAAALADGSLGVALRWVEDDVIGPAEDLVAQMDGILSGRPSDELPAWFKQAADDFAKKQMERDELGSEDQAKRAGLTLYLRLAAEHTRQKMAQTTDPSFLERACAAIDAVARAEFYLDANVNVSLIFQQLAAALRP